MVKVAVPVAFSVFGGVSVAPFIFTVYLTGCGGAVAGPLHPVNTATDAAIPRIRSSMGHTPDDMRPETYTTQIQGRRRLCAGRKKTPYQNIGRGGTPIPAPRIVVTYARDRGQSCYACG